jgi:hypothetical protein
MSSPQHSAPTDTSLPSDFFWSMPAVVGDSYLEVLDRFHRILRPETYFEIGVSSGATLSLANCSSIAVDPAIHANAQSLLNKSVCCLFQLTSDAFFAKYNPTAIFGQTIDIAFLDGMHLYEFLLRDFINTERHCKKNSVVFLHDCIPPDSHTARRLFESATQSELSKHPDFWAGDVWKTVAILKKYRPDLQIHAIDARPTGLIAITNLNPSSTLLANSYYQIIDAFREISLIETGDDYISSLHILPASGLGTLEAISERFWL